MEQGQSNETPAKGCLLPIGLAFLAWLIIAIIFEIAGISDFL